MSEISIGGFKINLKNLIEGLAVDKQNKFLQKYDKDGNSVFSAQELADLQADLETASGDDKTLSENEILNFYAKKMGVTIEVAKEKFAKYGNIIQKGVESLSGKNEDYIVNTLNNLIEDNLEFASVDNKKFQETFKHINSDNVINILKKYNQNYGEDLATAIMKERSASSKNKVSNVQTLYNLLYSQIDKSKFDTSVIEKDFKEFLKNQQINKLNNIFNTMIAMVEGKYIDKTATREETSTNAIERNQDAQTLADNKAQSQGGVSKVLDGIGGLSKRDVDKIIKEHQNKLDQLKAVETMPESELMQRFGTKDRNKAYDFVFKTIFGVEYKPAAVANYDKINDFINSDSVRNAVAIESFYQSSFANELSPDKVDIIFTHKGLKAAEETYNNFYQKMCEYFGKEIVDNFLKLSNAENEMAHNKYRILHKMLKSELEIIHQNTVKTCGGIEYSELQEKHDRAFNAAYGYENDTYLVAQKWIGQQQTRLNVAQTATQVAGMALTLFSGGTLGVVGAAVSLADPVSFMEQATDIDGMTQEDWSNFIKDRAEMIGWMALGMGAGAVGAAASKMVKIKGLSQLAQKAGMSLDDLLAKANLPKDIQASLIKAQKLADLAGVSTEVAVDISLTAALQENGATGADWIMSLSGAILGTKLGNKLTGLKEPDAVLELQKYFPDVKKEDALSIIRDLNQKAKTWAQDNSGHGNRLYSGVDVVAAVKGVVNKASDFVNNLLGKLEDNKLINDNEKNILSTYARKKPEYAAPITEAIEEIATRIKAGETPTFNMKNDILDNLIQKYPDLDRNNLKNELEIVMEIKLKQEGWRGISGCMMRDYYSYDYVEEVTDNFRKNRGWESGNTVAENKPQLKVEEKPDAVPEVKSQQVQPNKPSYDELLAKYPEVNNKFYSTEAENQVFDFLEDYTNILGDREITFDNFKEYTTELYQEIYSRCDALSDTEKDVLFKIVKERYHKNVIAEEIRFKDIQARPELKGISVEGIKAGDKIVEELKVMMKNGETIDSADFIDLRLQDIMGDHYDFRKVGKIEEYIYSNPEVKNFLNDCTHRDIRNNKAYTKAYQKETIENAIEALDKLYGLHKQGVEITLDDINATKNHINYSNDQDLPKLLDDILMNHHTMGPIYKKLLEES